MSYDPNETHEQRMKRWDEEEKVRLAKAQKLYEQYKADKRKPSETYKDRDGGHTSYTYDEGTKDSDKEIKRTTRTFRVSGGKVQYMNVSTNTKQKFLVVNGPLKGKKITDENEDYVLFNRNSAWRGASKGDVPKCVLVHRSAFET